MRRAEIKIHDTLAGWLTQDENGYHFAYDRGYLATDMPQPVSKTLFPFFDGLIPEGWLLDIAEKNRKLNARGRMGLLLVCGKDCIGAVSVHPINEDADAS